MAYLIPNAKVINIVFIFIELLEYNGFGTDLIIIY